MTGLPDYMPDPIMLADYLRTMADGTVKQVNPFTGTDVWTIPGRARRPLGLATGTPRPLTPEDFTAGCAFCSDRYLDTPPEKSRSVRAGDGFVRQHRLTAEAVIAGVAEFRRIPNLFEIISFDYWHWNYGHRLPPSAAAHMGEYLGSRLGREHVLRLMEIRVPPDRKADLSVDELLAESEAFFGSGHDVIVARRHYVDGATTDQQLASSGELTPAEHAEYTDITVDAMADLYAQNRYARYVAVFQNWLKPAGASFDHLHKQLVAIDERGIQNELEIRAVRANPNVFNDAAVNYAGYHNLVVAENDHAIAFAGFGHRYPSLEIYCKSERSEPWLLDPAERRGMSDLLHAMHAAAGANIPCNEEWHHRAPDVDVSMPWHIVVKWRVSTLAGFEGGTKVYLNTIDPVSLRDRVVPELFRLRDAGRIDPFIRIAEECPCAPNSLRYNPRLRER